MEHYYKLGDYIWCTAIIIVVITLITASATGLWYKFRVKVRYRDAIRLIKKSSGYFPVVKGSETFFEKDFKNQFFSCIITPIKAILMYLETFIHNEEIIGSTIEFLEFLGFRALINKMISEQLKTITTENEWESFKKILTAKKSSDPVKTVIQELINSDLYSEIENWKPKQ